MNDKHIYRVLSNNTENNDRSLAGHICYFYVSEKQRICSQCSGSIKHLESYYKCVDNYGELPKEDEGEIGILSSALYGVTHGHGESVCVACIQDVEIVGQYECKNINDEEIFIPEDPKFVLME